MQKTPEEIKKGLIEAIEETSWVVEGGDAHDLIDACEKAHASMADALDYIQQLENEVSAWEHAFSQIGDDGGVVRRELAHQRELIEKNVEMRRLEEAYHKLEAQVPRWISVEERLPEANVFGIVYVTNPVGWWDIEFDCVDEDGNWTINADSDWHTVTHWMPLPEPPKEGDDEG